MRVEFVGARVFAHGIDRDEIRAVVEYPIIVGRVEPRLRGSRPAQYWLVFHAMMLRRTTAKKLRLEKTYPEVV